MGVGQTSDNALDPRGKRAGFLLFFKPISLKWKPETLHKLVAWRAKIADRLLATGTLVDVGRHQLLLIRRQGAQHAVSEGVAVRSSSVLLACVGHCFGHSQFAVHMVTRSVSEGRTHCLAYASGYHVFDTDSWLLQMRQCPLTNSTSHFAFRYKNETQASDLWRHTRWRVVLVLSPFLTRSGTVQLARTRPIRLEGSPWFHQTQRTEPPCSANSSARGLRTRFGASDESCEVDRHAEIARFLSPPRRRPRQQRPPHRPPAAPIVVPTDRLTNRRY